MHIPRFNLLREESEGFAKLITALCQFAAAAPSSVSAVEALVRCCFPDPFTRPYSWECCSHHPRTGLVNHMLTFKHLLMTSRCTGMQCFVDSAVQRNG